MLKINNLNKTFNIGSNNEKKVFQNFNIIFKKNKCTSIIGPNGCGKSTLLNLISGSLVSDNGNIFLNDKNINKLKEEQRSVYISRVFQDPSKGVSPSLSVLENLSLAAKKGTPFTLKPLIKKNKFINTLKSLNMGLENQLNTKVKYLSGGQRQALSLVMATINNPNLLLLDEHTAALDPKTSDLIMNRTKELIDKNKITTIMVSHNLKDAIKYSDYIVMLNQGNVILYEESHKVTELDLMNIYNNI